MNQQASDMSMLFERWSQGSFAAFLRSYIVYHQGQRKSQTLRSFAKRFGVAPSTLSRLLAGRVTPKAVTIEKIGRKVGLNPEHIDRLIRQSTELGLSSTRIKRQFMIDSGSADVAIALIDQVIVQLQGTARDGQNDRMCSLVMEFLGTASLAGESGTSKCDED